MLPLEVRKYLFDVARTCALLAQFTNGKTFAGYAASPILRAAGDTMTIVEVTDMSETAQSIEEVLALLKTFMEREKSEYGLVSLGVFGSLARGEARSTIVSFSAYRKNSESSSFTAGSATLFILCLTCRWPRCLL
jgi:hypothetical protein